MYKNEEDEYIITLKPHFPRKRTIQERDRAHEINALNMLIESHLSMFEYKDLPESIDPIFLELFLQRDGQVCITDGFTGELIACECAIAGDLDAYGIGRDVVGVTRNGKSGNFKRGESCVVGWNNRSKTPLFDVRTDAQTLADIQTSIDFLIFWTRLSPLIRVSDEKIKQQVVDAFKNLRRGIPATIASKKTLEEFGLSDDISVDMLTQPDFADKIQYTAKLYDDVLRWHWTRYGHATNGNSKAAQQTVDEVDSTASQSMILPLSMLWARKKMIEDLNAMYGLEASVELSGAWRAEVTAYENQSGEASIDDSEDDPDTTLPDLDTDATTAEESSNTVESKEDQDQEEVKFETPIIYIDADTIEVNTEKKEEEGGEDA